MGSGPPHTTLLGKVKMKIKNILMGSLAAAVGAAGIISATTATAEEFRTTRS